MKKFSTYVLSVLCSLTAMAQPAEMNAVVPENLPLNAADAADAYSWLSKDGLRIYFTRDNSDDEIWKAERKSLTEEFKDPVSVTVNGISSDNDVFSCWLTDDEKTLFFVTHRGGNGFTTSLFRSTYDEVSKEFINPVKINLSGGDINETSYIFISGPSLTPDLKQLFVYYNDEHSDEHIACFTSNDGINYVFKLFLNNGNNYCPGSLADNGLSFYLSLRDEDNLLVKLSRPDLNSDFGNPEYFTVDKNINEGKGYYQPYVNTDLGLMAITFGLGNWESNDLAIVKLPTEKTIYKEKVDIVAEEVVKEVTEIEKEEVMAEVFEEVASIAEDKIVWHYIDVPQDSNTIRFIPAAHCTFGYEDSKVVFLGESSTDDTLSFDIEGDFIIPVSSSINSFSIKAMPNPASSYFTIVYNINTNSTERPIFEMTNLNGQIVKRFELESTSGNFEIDINGLAEGLYLYKLITPDFVSPVKKLVVKRQ